MCSGKAIWTVPEDCEPRKREYYTMVWERLLSKRSGFLETIGSFKNAYQNYNEKVNIDDKAERHTQSFPKYTNFTKNFTGTLDHIMFN